MGIQAQSVSELIGQIKNTLEGEFRATTVSGEVSNLSPSTAGHWYFNLSDEQSSISVALFKMDAMRNPLIRSLKNGDQIIITGPISVYGKRGTFQLLAKRIVAQGQGNLLVQFEKLKAQLTKEGYFDLSIKKPIPKFPKRIGVITAIGGAALQDFLNVLDRRSFWAETVIIPAVVQGDASAKSLVQALRKAKSIELLDVIVFTRGGGAIEDLWSFNNEELVKEIYQCSIPVISAVGHQVDYTLCDFVSDLRCETPTAAAEILSQPHMELDQRMKFVGHKLKNLLFRQHAEIEKRLKRFSPIHVLHILKQNFFDTKKRLEELELKDRAFELVGLYDKQMYLDDLVIRMQKCIENKLVKESHRVAICESRINGLNPKSVLKRGYSIIQDSNNNIITNSKNFTKIPNKEKLIIQFSDGTGQVLKDD